MSILSLRYIVICILLISITKDSAENEKKKSNKKP